MPDLHKLTPTTVRVDGKPSFTFGWDAALVALAAQVEARGRLDDLPAKWFTTFEKIERAKAVRVGEKWLVTSVNREQLVKRATRCAEILRSAGVEDVSVTFREHASATLPEPSPLSKALHALLPQPDPVPASVTVGTVVHEVDSGWKGALRVLVEAADLHNRLDSLPAAWFRISESPSAMRVLRLDLPVDELTRRFDHVARALHPIHVAVTYSDGRTFTYPGSPTTPLLDRTPESILVGLIGTDVASWRAAYTFAVRQAIEHGFARLLPRDWFVSVPSGNSSEVLVEGHLVQTAVQSHDCVARMEILADVLSAHGWAVTVKFTDGSDHTYPLSRVKPGKTLDPDAVVAQAVLDGISPGVRRALKALLLDKDLA